MAAPASVEPTVSPYDEYPHVLTLVYHHVHPTQDNFIAITPAMFESHLSELAAAGYEGITLSQYVGHIENGAPLPDRAVMITFDDAWENQYDYALPLLEKHGFSATFFAYKSVIGGGKFMSESQLRDLVSRGFDLQSHSIDHSSLMGAVGPAGESKAETAIDELKRSRSWIEGISGVACGAFAYPYGYYDEYSAAAIIAAGYSVAVTVDDGVNSSDTVDPLHLRRFTVFREESLEDFTNRFGAVLLPLTGHGPLTVDDPSPGTVTLWCELDTDETLDAESLAFIVDAEEAPATVVKQAGVTRIEATTSLDSGFHYIGVRGQLTDGRIAYEAWGLVTD